jgi:predicted nucleotidyltransferase
MNLLLYLSLRGLVAFLLVHLFDEFFATRMSTKGRRWWWMSLPFAFLVSLPLPILPPLTEVPAANAGSLEVLSPSVDLLTQTVTGRLGFIENSLQRELQDLSDARILNTHRQGRMVYYQANVDSPLFPDLRGLLLKTAGLADVLVDALKPLASKLRIVFVYGSIASGSEQAESDIDLMVVGTVSPVELALPAHKIRKEFRRRLRDLLDPLQTRRIEGCADFGADAGQPSVRQWSQKTSLSSARYFDETARFFELGGDLANQFVAPDAEGS